MGDTQYIVHCKFYPTNVAFNNFIVSKFQIFFCQCVILLHKQHNQSSYFRTYLGELWANTTYKVAKINILPNENITSINMQYFVMLVFIECQSFRTNNVRIMILISLNRYIFLYCVQYLADLARWGPHILLTNKTETDKAITYAF